MAASLAILMVAAGVVLFLLKLMMTTTTRWVERTFNEDVAAATTIANDGGLPADWRSGAEAAGRRSGAHSGSDQERSKRWLLRRLDRVIERVEGGRAFEPDAREFALGQLREARDRWRRQSYAEICNSKEEKKEKV